MKDFTDIFIEYDEQEDNVPLDKAIEHGKEHRKQYRRSKSFDRTCRNHGSCAYCRGSRTNKDIAKQKAFDEQIVENKFIEGEQTNG